MSWGAKGVVSGGKGGVASGDAKGVANYGAKANELCFSCALAYGGTHCPWFNGHRPVPGWTAEETRIRPNKGAVPNLKSYKIIDCPMFVKETRGNKPRPTVASDEWAALLYGRQHKR